MAALDETTLQGDVAAARRGDRDALERVVRAIQDPIYHLAMRMLGHPDDARDASQEVLVRVVLDEAKQVCTQGMLLCLDRPHRLAYILGEILELSGEDAAAVLAITPAAYRKRLSRAREDMEAFLGGRCGLANPGVACRCHKLAPAAIASGLIDPARLALAKLPVRRVDRLSVDIERVRTAAEVFRSLPEYASSKGFAAQLRHLLDPGAN